MDQVNRSPNISLLLTEAMRMLFGLGVCPCRRGLAIPPVFPYKTQIHISFFPGVDLLRQSGHVRPRMGALDLADAVTTKILLH